MTDMVRTTRTTHKAAFPGSAFHSGEEQDGTDFPEKVLPKYELVEHTNW